MKNADKQATVRKDGRAFIVTTIRLPVPVWLLLRELAAKRQQRLGGKADASALIAELVQAQAILGDQIDALRCRIEGITREEQDARVIAASKIVPRRKRK